LFLKVLLVLNTENGILGASETFISSHIGSFKPNIHTLVGNPGYRIVDQKKGNYLLSRHVLLLMFRWVLRLLKLTTVAEQDTVAVSRFIKSQKIDVVLAEYGPTAVSVLDACKNANVPLVAHFHGYDASRHSLLEEYVDKYKELFNYASAVIGVSRLMCERLEAMGCDPEIIHHNACGAAVTKRNSSTQSKDAFSCVMVGRMTEKKAPFLSLLAFSEVARMHKGAHLDVLGGGQLFNACIQLVKGLGIESQVTFHGECEHELVFRKLREAECFIQHSVTAQDGDMEGTPVGVLEAMGMGLAVVSTRHAGILDIIDEGRTGFLVDEYDWKEMAEILSKLASDSDLVSSVGLRASEAVLSQWTEGKSCSRLKQILTGCLNNDDRQLTGRG